MFTAYSAGSDPQIELIIKNDRMELFWWKSKKEKKGANQCKK